MARERVASVAERDVMVPRFTSPALSHFPPTLLRPTTAAMTDNFAVAATPQAHAADVEFLVRRGMTKGYQLMSLLTPPLYATFALSRYGRAQFSVNRLLRATWVGGVAGECSLLPQSVTVSITNVTRSL